MGRRSRKRGPETVPARAPVARRAPPDERPRAPWHPFPLVELCVFIGLVLLVWGLFTADEASGRVLLVTGMALGSLGGLDTALREHFSGYRSHALLIAALPAVFVAGVLFFTRAPWVLIPVCAGAVLAGGFVLMRRAFRARH